MDYLDRIKAMVMGDRSPLPEPEVTFPFAAMTAPLGAAAVATKTSDKTLQDTSDTTGQSSKLRDPPKRRPSTGGAKQRICKLCIRVEGCMTRRGR